MKKFSFLVLLAAGMLLGACTSDKDVTAEGNVIDARGDGYIGISIQLPNSTTPTLPTRNNDQYDDGDATEYAVKSGKVLFFKGATEATATFLQAQDIISPADGWNTDGSDYVTSTKTAVAKIENITFASGEKLYAYVVLNYVGTGLAANPAKGTPFSTWSEKVVAAASTGGTLEGEISTNGLLMTNAPIADTQGGSADPTGANITTAVELDKNAIKPTKDEAADTPAGCVFVERAAAKVTLEVTATATKIDMGGTDLAMDVNTIAWQIINVEEDFYNTRQANFAEWLPYMNAGASNENSKYRFVSNNLFSPKQPSITGHQDGYRTYFAKDPTYITDHDELAKSVAIDDDDHWLGTYAEAKMKRAYVPENTFPVEYMTRKNTTCATIRVKFNGGADFYTISNDPLYYDETNAKAKIASNIAAWYDVDNYWDQAVADLTSTKGVTISGSLVVEFTTTTAGLVTYTVTPSFTGGGTTYTLADVDATIASNLEDAIATAKADYKVYLYEDGFAYYNVRIKHFGDVETPWSSTATYITKPGSGTNGAYLIDDIYGTVVATRNNDFLGRYGIVRDNWYKLSIDGIAKLGSATPPSVKDDPTPDDEIEDEYYISAHVHILPWVIRTQSVNL